MSPNGDSVFVESQIKFQHIYARFTENGELALLNVASDKGTDLIFAEATDSRNTWYFYSFPSAATWMQSIRSLPAVVSPSGVRGDFTSCLSRPALQARKSPP